MITLINTRRSVRRWTADGVSDPDIRDILEAAMNAPSAGNEQAWQFVVLRGTTVNDYVAINRNCPPGAPVGILVCGDLLAQKYDGYHLYDCCAAIQNILLAAHAKGLGAVWTAVFPTSVDAIHQLLGLPDYIVPVGFVPIGVPAGAPPAYVSRYDEAKVHDGKW